MQKIENTKIKECVYKEILENGLTVMIIPKKTIKKYVIWGTKYGSNDNKFIPYKGKKPIEVPNGIAHFLEHKLFEQENGTNSLDVLTSLGVSANAYTTNDHTAYLFEATENFYEALDELMDYVQHPYFTKENVEKEQGIIEQEISMYDDYPEWVVYLNAMKAMYQENPVRIDITGTKETIHQINKDILYQCYDTFYHPSNMVMVVCGDFEPELLLQEIKKRLIPREERGKIERIYPEEPKEVAQKEMIQHMEVSTPIFVIGFKDIVEEDMLEKHIAMEILLNSLIGKSSILYQKLYEKGYLMEEPQLDYEFSSNYAHITITGQSKDPKKVKEELMKKIAEKKEKGVEEAEFQRCKKMLYGTYVREFNSVGDIARMFLADYFKGINSLDYIEKIEHISKEYTQKILEKVLREENQVISIVK